jgi:hypothetical protein
MAAAAAEGEVKACLRFLTKDARLPLVEAMGKISQLRKLDLATPEKIAQAQNADLKIVFTDEKVLKQVVSAAKRVSNPKKRAAPALKREPGKEAAVDEEAVLALPVSEKTEDELSCVVIETNRAPLFLAFTLAVLPYTHPDQPISSKLSLAQAVVSAGAQSKARSIGLSGPTAEEDGWAMGQPKVRIMGREVAVMRRQTQALFAQDNHATVPAEEGASEHTAFWGLDLEALRKSNGPLIAGGHKGSSTGPPIHTPKAARSYLLRSMNFVDSEPEIKKEESPAKSKKQSAAQVVARKEEAAAAVLKAIDIALSSWQQTLSPDELDRRAQSWYAMVRPDVAQGKEGWGQRGHLKLQDILRFKRTP